MLFFTNKGPAIQIPVPKGRTVTGKFYKNVVLRKLKNYKSRRPKTCIDWLKRCVPAGGEYFGGQSKLK